MFTGIYHVYQVKYIRYLSCDYTWKRAEQLRGNYRKVRWITQGKGFRWLQQKDRNWEKGRRIKTAEVIQEKKIDWRNEIATHQAATRNKRHKKNRIW